MPSHGRKSLIRRLQNLGLTQREAETAIETLLQNISDGLEKDGKVMISDFGRFEVRHYLPRAAKLPGQPLKRLPARRTVRFKPSRNLFASLITRQ